MVRASLMITYGLAQSRRHVYELRDGSDVIAEINIHAATRAEVTTLDGRYALEAIDGIRKRVVKHGDRSRTAARSSSLGRYAIDLESGTLYWHALPGPAGTYCWMTGEGTIVARYTPRGDGDFLVQVDRDAVSSEDAIVIGAFLLMRTLLEVAAFTTASQRSLAFAARAR